MHRVSIQGLCELVREKFLKVCGHRLLKALHFLLLSNPIILGGPTPTMTSLSGTMPIWQAHSQRPLHIVPYAGPPKPKKTPLRIPSKKVPPSDDEYHNIDEFLGMEPDWNIKGGKREELAYTAHAVGVVDLTCSGQYPYADVISVFALASFNN